MGHEVGGERDRYRQLDGLVVGVASGVLLVH